MDVLRYPLPDPGWRNRKKVFKGYAHEYLLCLASGNIRGALEANNTLLEMRERWTLSSTEFIGWEEEKRSELIRSGKILNWKKEG